MEGESLFNDSSSIVLFKIFFDMVKRLSQGKPGSKLGMGAEALSIATNIFWLSFGQYNPAPADLFIVASVILGSLLTCPHLISFRLCRTPRCSCQKDACFRTIFSRSY